MKITEEELLVREQNSVKGNAGIKLIDFVESELKEVDEHNILRYIRTMGASEIISAMAKTIIIILLFSCKGYSQVLPTYNFKLKEHKVSLAFTALQGLSDGLRDASIFGRMRDKRQWWNGVDSWQNKYKNGDPLQGAKFFGSTNVFVFTTDAPHAANMVSNLSGEMAKVYMPNMSGSTFWQKFKTVVIYSTIRSAGHNLIYGLIFKQK